MRNVLLRSTSIAVLGFGLAAAPMAFAQDAQTTSPSVTAPAPSVGTAPDPNTTVPGSVDNRPVQGEQGSMGQSNDPTTMGQANDPAMPNTTGTGMSTTGTAGTMGTAATGTDMQDDRVTIVGGTQPMGTVLATDLQGEPVENSAGEDLATLDDFVIDEQGRIVGAVVSFGGFLGMGEKSVLLPWEDLTIDGTSARVMLSMTEEQIDALPEFEEREMPNDALASDPARTTAPAPANPAAPATAQ
jgi:sporulation protein YlmC with PRC-barrel domain